MWEEYLAADEEVRWTGRPAPRCYTFRHWRHSIFGTLFLLICIYWQVLGVLMAETYATAWLAWLPLPFLLIGVYFSIGHLVQARLEWNHVFYVITNRRLLCQRGLRQRRIQSMELASVTYFKLQLKGEQLGTLQVYHGEKEQLILHCLEYPRQATDLLEESMQREQRLVTVETEE